MDASPPDLDALLAAMADLVADREAERGLDPGEGNFSCEDCSACYNCRFCVSCDSCEDCTYCEGCVDCLGCTQSKRCVSCERCSYIEDSRDCEGCRYVVLCIECKDSVHCLGCVGLEGGEYCVLNEPVGKKRFFEVLNRVRDELERRAGDGWRPQLIGLVDAADADLEADDDDASAAQLDDDFDDDIDNPWHARPERGPKSEQSGVQAGEDDQAGADPWAPRRPRREREVEARDDSPWQAASPRRQAAPVDRRRAPARDLGRDAPVLEASKRSYGDDAGRRATEEVATVPRRRPTESSDLDERRAPPPSAPPLPERMPWEDSQVIDTDPRESESPSSQSSSRLRAPRVEATPTPMRPHRGRPEASREPSASRSGDGASRRETVPAPPTEAPPAGGLRRGRPPPRRRKS